MPRSTPPELVSEIQTLTRQGHNQTAIARLLNIQQPRVSKIMRAHGIRLAVDPRFIKGSSVYHLPEGPMTISVQIQVGGRPQRTTLHASPQQLRELADYAEEVSKTHTLLVEQQSG